MNLPSELISQFVKATKDETKTKSETTVYGTTVVHEGRTYVKLDGSDLLTPVSTTADTKADERVTIMIKNHTATITGNMSSPAARTGDLNETNNKISEFDIVIADKVSTAQLEVEQARIDALEAENVVIKGIFTASEADIYELKANDATITEKLTAAEADIDSLETNKLDASVATATYVTIANLEATNADLHNLEATYAEFEKLTAADIDVINASIKTLEADKLDASTADITYAKITDLDAAVADINLLQANVAGIDTLIFGSASGDTIQASFANAVIAQLGDAQIKSAMIESISADKITAGDIITNNVRVKSQNGLLLISDETIQISDDARVRVQIGKDAANDYSINIWDAEGNLMFSKGGITDSAIKDAIIRNDMVSDTANIAAHKLDIDSLFEEINGSTNTIKSTQIYLDDEAQTLDVAFKELETEVSELGTTVSSQGTQLGIVQGQITSKIWQQDIDTATEEMSTQYTTIEQKVNGVATTVASHDTQIASKAESSTVTEITDRVTSVETELSGFKVAVSETYATEKELESATEQLAISGRNLIVRRGELTDTYVVASGEVLPSDSSYKSATMADPIRVNAGETYTFSKDEIAAGYFFRWAWFDKDMNVLGRTANDGASFQWTVPDNAAYIIVSYPYVEGTNPKIEKGEVATEYCPAVEDMVNVIDAKFTNYSTTLEMEAAIKLSESAITSSVSKTYTTKNEFEALEIGGCNLIKNSDFSVGLSRWVPVGTTCTVEEDDNHGHCVKMVSTEVGSSNSRLYPSTTDNFVHTGGKYTLSFYAKADAATTIQTNVAGGDAGVCNYELTSAWKKFVHTYEASAGSITFWSNEANTTIYLTKIKLEHGEKATDWTPAPEDMATNGDVNGVQSAVDSIDERVITTESLIQQLSDSIATLVTDGAGTSLMTQTEEGWTFSTAEIQTAIASTAESLDTLTNELGDTNSTVDVLQQAVADLGEIAEYVKIGTYNDEPCIELGEGDSEFKLRITNTQILFMEGSSIIAHFTNQSLHIKKAVIEEELQQGGFVWKVRSNGNMGLVWKGVSS